MIVFGNKYGNWTVIDVIPKTDKRTYYLCICDCGANKRVRSDDLIKSNSKFCMKCRHASVEIKISDRFGKWTVLRKIEAEEKRKHYEVQCECGFIRILKGIRLRFGDSIGCRKCGSTKHGMVHSPTYSSWECMIQRCTNKKHVAYKWYGGKGIKVCERWLKFENFLEDMGIRPKNKEIDRIDSEKDYEPGNCQWITHEENLKKI